LTALPGQRDQGCTDDNQRNRSQQFFALDHSLICLHRHNNGVNETRSCGEGEHAATR
jgi:hypothetical protein